MQGNKRQTQFFLLGELSLMQSWQRRHKKKNGKRKRKRSNPPGNCSKIARWPSCKLLAKTCRKLRRWTKRRKKRNWSNWSRWGCRKRMPGKRSNLRLLHLMHSLRVLPLMQKLSIPCSTVRQLFSHRIYSESGQTVKIKKKLHANLRMITCLWRYSIWVWFGIPRVH